jgi:hypothetical protein
MLREVGVVRNVGEILQAERLQGNLEDSEALVRVDIKRFFLDSARGGVKSTRESDIKVSGNVHDQLGGEVGEACRRVGWKGHILECHG